MLAGAAAFGGAGAKAGAGEGVACAKELGRAPLRKRRTRGEQGNELDDMKRICKLSM